MKPEMKKLIIANLPYLLFVYLFGKLGQTYRLAAGADLSEKLLHLADGFSLAFESAAPSFHLFDLAVGVAGAVALRLMVYCKSKNAKKYRRGVEYGSARWGGPKDIAPYIDPVFDNNILLTQTERLTMNNRPKDPKLWTYLADLDEQAQNRLDCIIAQIKETEGVTEELKAKDQLAWVGHMNSIRHRAEEVIRSEMIFV